MDLSMKIVIILTVILCEQSFYNASFIHQYIDGRLTNSWRISVNIFVNDFIGVILNCIDSGKNHLSLNIIREGIGKSVAVKFNTMSKIIPLRPLCGCDPCDVSLVFLYIRLRKDMLDVMCNYHLAESFKIDSSNNVVAIQGHSKIHIVIGKIPPYIGISDSIIQSQNQQMIGCLNYFKFNKRPVQFIGEEMFIKATCPRKCSDNTCNNGECIENEGYITCDCSSTIFNGQYCDRKMKAYNKGIASSFEKIENVKEMYFKMTWKQLMTKSYCIIEIIGRRTNVTISIKKNHLLMGSMIVATIDTNVVNFVTVYIARDILTLKTKNMSSNMELLADEMKRINIGFVEQNSGCVTFEGVYDIQYNSTVLQEVQYNLTAESQIMLNNIFNSILLIVCIVIVCLGISVRIWLPMKLLRMKKLRDSLTSTDDIDLRNDPNPSTISTICQ